MAHGLTLVWGGCLQRAYAPQGYPPTVRTARTPFRVRDSVQGTRGPTISRASRRAKATRGGGKGSGREGRRGGTSPLPNLQLIPRSNVISVFLSLEPATSKGVGRRAEGSDDAIRAADIVLQRGTLVSHNPSSPPTHARAFAFACIHILSGLSLVVLSDRDRTFTAQCRAHAALIRFSSRRAGEERRQGPEGRRRHCEWDRLTLPDVVKYQCTLTTRTLYIFHLWITFGKRESTQIFHKY